MGDGCPISASVPRLAHHAETELDVSTETGLIQIHGVEALRARKLTYFVDCQRLVGDLKRAAEKGALERRMRFYSHLSLLIVDEVGYLDVDKEGADLLFQLVSRRYERRSTIVTTNVGIGAWAKVFGDPVVASAIADRPCHHCTVLKITGRSYRTKDLAPDRDAGNGA